VTVTGIDLVSKAIGGVSFRREQQWLGGSIRRGKLTPGEQGLQALENFCDLTLEAWNHVFSRKVLFWPQFRDSTISMVHLHALCLRVDAPDEPYAGIEPLSDFVLHLIPSVIGRHGFDHEVRYDTTVPLRHTVIRELPTAYA
jgi:hypothetical protein